MPNKIPDKVSLVVRRGESQVDFARRLFMEAARLAGMPLLEQVFFAEYMIKSGEHLFVGKDEKLRLKWAQDPSPKDKDPLISDREWKAKYGQSHTHILGDFNKQELERMQTSYTLNGGVLGSLLETKSDKIIVDLNIVYDPNLINDHKSPPNKLEQIQQALKPKLDYWTQTFSKINLDYTVRYNTGMVNSSRTEITSGTLTGMANIFYFNDPKSLYAYSKLDTGSDHIFLSELKNDLLYDRAICHECGHLFGITGLSGIFVVDAINYVFPVANIISDVKINTALENLKSNSVKYGIDWIDDYRKAPKHIYHTPQIGKLGPDATRRVSQREPTIYDIFRYGARMLKGEKK